MGLLEDSHSDVRYSSGITRSYQDSCINLSEQRRCSPNNYLPADFSIDDEKSGVRTLLTSIASVEMENLWRVSIKNFEEISAQGKQEEIPHARELISAIWMYSMSPARQKGALRQELQLAITRQQQIDDNAFRHELTQLIESSFNIHGNDTAENRLWFGPHENPRTKIKVTAKNDRFGIPEIPSNRIFPYTISR